MPSEHLLPFSNTFHTLKDEKKLVSKLVSYFSTFYSGQVKVYHRLVKQNLQIDKQNLKNEKHNALGKTQKPISENIVIDYSNFQSCSQLVHLEELIAVQSVSVMKGVGESQTDCFIYLTKFGVYFLQERGVMVEVIPYQNIDNITLDKNNHSFDMTFEALDGLDRMITVHYPIPELIIKSIFNTSHLNGLKQFVFTTKQDLENMGTGSQTTQTKTMNTQTK